MATVSTALPTCTRKFCSNTGANNFYKIYPEQFNNKTNGITSVKEIYKF